MLKSFADEFKAFIMRGNVVDLAIGVVIGVAFKSIVDHVVDGLLMPIVNMITAGYDFKNSTFNPFGSVVFKTGEVFQATLSFVIVGFFCFLVVKAMNKFIKKPDAKPAEPTESEKLLAEIRDLLKK